MQLDGISEGLAVLHLYGRQSVWFDVGLWMIGGRKFGFAFGNRGPRMGVPNLPTNGLFPEIHVLQIIRDKKMFDWRILSIRYYKLELALGWNSIPITSLR